MQDIQDRYDTLKDVIEGIGNRDGTEAQLDVVTDLLNEAFAVMYGDQQLEFFKAAEERLGLG